ncbi:hypothetical protein ICM05_10250 [Leucobacter sp. cx-42]|uniref:hypothetical protein n=1 Tax=unclassified Leucobacter TaxID=2621730 RepID=UPI00165D4B65|nr:MULTISPECIES: hypothetical protein [unclassified Leucobacter]MBC9955012.1 hypothetical protein [Leucobacter sp. cx-42]
MSPSADWRFGPLHHAAGEVLLGDPLGNHAVVSGSGICGVQADQFDEFLPWDSLTNIDFSCDTTRSRAGSRLFDALSALLTASSGEAAPLDPHDPGELRLETIAGEVSTWRIDAMDTGKYWLPYVEATQVFLEMMRVKPGFRVITEDAAALATWFRTAVSEAQR